MKELNVHQNSAVDAIELQTKNDKVVLVGVVFHSGINRLSLRDAREYANLFATAPKLLEACKGLVSVIEQWNDGDATHADVKFGPAFEIGCAAITEAEQTGD